MVDGDVTNSGVPHGQLLVDWAAAAASFNLPESHRLGREVVAQLGPEALIDGAGVIGCFNAIVRIADATGIPLEEQKADASVEIRQQLGIDDFRP